MYMKLPSLMPRVVLGGYIDGKGKIRPNDPAVYRRGPTLAELLHAFFGRNPDGSWVSPEYRENMESESGEFTSTFLQNGALSIERPESLSYDKKIGLWIAEGGNAVRIELPHDGWVVEYDEPTGWPSRTSPNKNDAKRAFGGDASYFSAIRKGLRAAAREYYVSDYGKFFINARFTPVARQFIGLRESILTL